MNQTSEPREDRATEEDRRSTSDQAYPSRLRTEEWAVPDGYENAEIYWADETAVKQDTAWVRGYAPAGKTPVLPHAARWSQVTMISAVTNQGLVRFAFYPGAINTDRFIDFMDRLI